MYKSSLIGGYKLVKIKADFETKRNKYVLYGFLCWRQSCLQYLVQEEEGLQ